MNGFPLMIFWLGEAGLILAVGVLLPIHRLFDDEPVCLACGSRCLAARNLPRFADDREDEFVAAIENREFESIASHDAALHEDDPELTMRLVSCQHCNKTNVLTVNHIAWYIDANDLATVKTNVLINQLLITPDESRVLKMICEQICQQRAIQPANKSERDPSQSEPR